MPVAGLVRAEQADDPADLVVRNGRIYTGDPRRPFAGALALPVGMFTFSWLAEHCPWQ